MELQEKLKSLQARQKDLTVKRDQFLREAGIEERKLEESLEKLRDLGIPDPQLLLPTEIEEMIRSLNTELEADTLELDAALTKGEMLLTNQI